MLPRLVSRWSNIIPTMAPIVCGTANHAVCRIVNP